MKSDYDYIIIGAGIIGLATARTLIERSPQAKILILEKEGEIAQHSTGRSSGVLHAGFYYTSETLKARFSVLGNKALRQYCTDRKLPLNTCGKLVVAQNDTEVQQLHELKRRGDANGSSVELVTEAEARKINPLAKTSGTALYSPLTATVDPRAVAAAMAEELRSVGVEIRLRSPYRGRDENNVIRAGREVYSAKMIINCAGVYADRIAQDYGFGTSYTIIPFKGLYLKYHGDLPALTTHIYPVPDLKQTFLGVHFTLTADNHVKIGPTAIPAFWRENYTGVKNFSAGDLVEILYYQARLFATNAFNFRSLAFEEMKKYSRAYLASLATKLADQFDPGAFREFMRPGIRAQLIEKKTLKLVMDFIVEGDSSSVHVLNAISPGFTCSVPFSEYVVDNWILPRAVHGAEESSIKSV
ncbi:MAG: L-2-hydroxyglutarate oxidase [Deltaproteobacteria bacterium]|nr:L-2-hydroxyglutarate oxidase [Deltaproteobacteria bacterium]